MDYKYNDSRKPVSVLQGDRFYFDRILSRESSVGQSSRIYYRSAEGVPFKWEMQPGTPKHPPENEVIPPLNPPPAVQSMGLPRPCVDQPSSKGSTKSRVWFWKKFKKSQESKRVQNGPKESTNASNISSERFERSKIGDSDGEFVASVHNSSSSSSSFSSSASSRDTGPPLQPSRSTRRDLLDGPFSCSPWNITAILSEVDSNAHHSRDQKTDSALGWNRGLLFQRILSRKSSMRHSTPRIYHDQPRSVEGVPFKWEMQPGTPYNLAVDQEADAPPPSPPPAVQSLGLPRPCIGQSKGGSKWSSIWLWKEIKKTIKTIKFKNSPLLTFKVWSLGTPVAGEKLLVPLH